MSGKIPVWEVSKKKKPTAEVLQRTVSIWVPVTSRTLMSDYEITPTCSFYHLSIRIIWFFFSSLISSC